MELASTFVGDQITINPQLRSRANSSADDDCVFGAGGMHTISNG
jgi:hypothetical protein